MAATIMCNGPDGGPAAVMVTMLADGDTVGLCPPCLTDWCEALLKATAPQRLAPQPEAPKRRPRAKKPAGTPVTAILGADGHDSGVTVIGGKVVDGASAAT